MSVAAYVTDGGTLSYQWFSITANNNTSGASEENATSNSYTPSTTTAGTVYYYANNSVNGIKTAIARSNTATFTVTSVTSVETPDASLARVYPNPTEGVITLEFEAQGAYQLTLADMNGKVLLRESVIGQTAQIDISAYPEGVYLLTIDDGKRQTTTRVVKN